MDELNIIYTFTFPKDSNVRYEYTRRRLYREVDGKKSEVRKFGDNNGRIFECLLKKNEVGNSGYIETEEHKDHLDFGFIQVSKAIGIISNCITRENAELRNELIDSLRKIDTTWHRFLPEVESYFNDNAIELERKKLHADVDDLLLFLRSLPKKNELATTLSPPNDEAIEKAKFITELFLKNCNVLIALKFGEEKDKRLQQLCEELLKAPEHYLDGLLNTAESISLRMKRITVHEYYKLVIKEDIIGAFLPHVYRWIQSLHIIRDLFLEKLLDELITFEDVFDAFVRCKYIWSSFFDGDFSREELEIMRKHQWFDMFDERFQIYVKQHLNELDDLLREIPEVEDEEIELPCEEWSPEFSYGFRPPPPPYIKGRDPEWVPSRPHISRLSSPFPANNPIDFIKNRIIKIVVLSSIARW